MKVAILGYGIEGKASAKYFKARGDEVTVCDEKLPVPDGFAGRTGPQAFKNLKEFDLIIRSAGLRPARITEANPDDPRILDRVTTSLNEFLRVCPSHKIVGITGTKGKGTTSKLAALMLEAAGLPVHFGGNVGIAPLDMLPGIKAEDFVVLELSSFQLIDLKQSVATAVCLSIAPEHLNWHADLDEYFSAKANLFRLQTPNDRAIYNRRSELSEFIVKQGPARKQSYEVPPQGEQPLLRQDGYVADGQIYYQDNAICRADEAALIGAHNLENICAAVTAVWPLINGNVEAIRTVIKSFNGLPHHLEYVDEVDGVKYYDDSYATMPDATVAALAAIPQTKVLILGGGSKGLELDHMITAVTNSGVRHVVLQGSLAGQLEEMLRRAGFEHFSHSPNDMPGIVAEAKKHAKTGDVVLLSPGLPAKGDGYFIDNVDRGNQFQAIVHSLAKGAKVEAV